MYETNFYIEFNNTDVMFKIIEFLATDCQIKNFGLMIFVMQGNMQEHLARRELTKQQTVPSFSSS